MKKSNPLSKVSLIAFSFFILISSCKKAESEPDNQINDASGIIITLTWPTIATYTNLDLRLIKSPLSNISPTLLVSNSKSDYFETLNFTNTTPTTVRIPSLNGDFILTPIYSEGNPSVLYTITIVGISNNKTITKTGAFGANLASILTCGTSLANCPRVQSSININKTDNRYTITE